MTTAKKLAQALNEYDERTPVPERDPWNDVITGFPVDEDATAEADPNGSSDIVVLTDGSRVGYDYERQEWRVYA